MYFLMSVVTGIKLISNVFFFFFYLRENSITMTFIYCLFQRQTKSIFFSIIISYLQYRLICCRIYTEIIQNVLYNEQMLI